VIITPCTSSRGVPELADDLPVSRPAVSQHLRVLKDAGLVSDQAEGTRRVYAINPAGQEALRADLDRFWTHALTAFKTVAEGPSRSERENQRRRRSYESFTFTGCYSAWLHADAPIRKTILVSASAERAFQVFTEEVSTWWPLSTSHIGRVDAKSAVIEPFVGGRWFERGVDGSECDWGRVRAWDPPRRLGALLGDLQ
jgi:DNA-binding MarR family transcriptional regulator